MLLMKLGFLESVKHKLILLVKDPLEFAFIVVDATSFFRIGRTPADFLGKYTLKFACNVVDAN